MVSDIVSKPRVPGADSMPQRAGKNILWQELEITIFLPFDILAAILVRPGENNCFVLGLAAFG